MIKIIKNWLNKPVKSNDKDVKNIHAIIFFLIMLFAMTVESIFDLIF